jgi:toxin YoeB
MIYEIVYTRRAEEDLQRHKKSGDKIVQKKVVRLLKELEQHPIFGIGKPEPLKGDKTGQWARRITDKHRLVYEIHENIVTVIVASAWGHYDDK